MAPTCSQVIHEEKIKYLTVHGKVQECQLWFVYNVHQSDTCLPETRVQVGVLHQAGLLS